jgi:hypothetical protein
MKYLIVLLFISSAASAQFVSVPYNMHTPYGNVPMHQQVYMPMNYGNGNSNPKYNFVVTLKSDSVIKFKSRIQSEKKKMYLVYKSKKGKKRISPSDTKEIIGISFAYGPVRGLPADSCWLYKVTSGEINCYTSVPVKDISYAMAIQKGRDGEIVALNKKNLEAITGTEDEQIVKWIKREKFVKAIEYYNSGKKTSK